MNRVKVGFFSLTRHSPTGDDRPYLTWHRLDHMPEQYQLPGMLLGQRWASTPSCRAARAAEVGPWSSVEHVVCYLMGNPVDETVDEFLALGRHLADQGRYPHALPSQYRGGLRLLEAVAAPRILISAEVVPFRPHLGTYVIIDQPEEGASQDSFLHRMHTDLLPTLVGVPGVAGAWSYTTTRYLRRPMFSEGRHRMIVCYLDDDPATVGERLSPVVAEAWADAPARPVLAAPFDSLDRSDVDRFGPVGP